jgi:serine/threonine protein kinase
MGAVYLARHKTLRRYCAIKVIKSQLSQEKAAAERFLREARATAALSHPNLVNVFDFDQHEGQYFIAMEYIEGRSLGSILRDVGGLPLPLALYFLNQAAVGLQYIHERDIVHRDIKPDNMIIDTQGTLKIMDLGLAKDHVEGDQSMTMTGMVMGSPHYMSPEQIHDAKSADCRTDIYSLGISFYQMVTGTVPFTQSSAAAVCVAHLQQPMPSVGYEDEQLRDALDGFIGKMTAKVKEDRFSSASEVVEVLQSWTASYPMEESSQAFFASLDMTQYGVSRLLEQSGIDSRQVDLDFESESADTAARLDEGAPTPAGSLAPVDPAVGKSSNLLIVTLVIALFVAVGVVFTVARKAKNQGAGEAAGNKTAAIEQTAVQPAAPPPAAAQVKTPVEKQITKLGGLAIETSPPGARVFFRSKTKTSPVSFDDVPVGKYTLQISAPHYRDETREVEIQPEKLTSLEIVLQRMEGSVRLESEPNGAIVLIDGRVRGRTPYVLNGGDGEELAVDFLMKGHERQSAKVTLKADGGAFRVMLPRARNLAALEASENPASIEKIPVRRMNAPPTQNSDPQQSISQADVVRMQLFQSTPPVVLQVIRSSIGAARVSKTEWTRSQKNKTRVMLERELKQRNSFTPQVNKTVTEVMLYLDQINALHEDDVDLKMPEYFKGIRDSLAKAWDFSKERMED